MSTERPLSESFSTDSYAEMAPNYLSIAGRLVDRARVDAVAFGTETVDYPAQSPAHFWREQSRLSSVFREALEPLDDGERGAIEERCIEAIDPYFDGWENAVVLEYLVTEATVR